MNKPKIADSAAVRIRGWGGLLGVVAALIGGGTCPGWAEETAELVRLIDSPTAGLIAKGCLGIDMRLFPNGGLLGQLDAGVLQRLNIGVSFGGERIIGDEEVDWNPRVEAAVRYRLIQESQRWPALVLGYETQGYGPYRAKRYQVKSKGAFVALSKNYVSSLGQFGVHGGVNLSREEGDGDEDVSGWVGMDKSFNEELMLVGEYDLATNDNGRSSAGSGRGYLNAGVHWAPVPHLSIGFLLKNILDNGEGIPKMSRELTFRYLEEF